MLKQLEIYKEGWRAAQQLRAQATLQEDLVQVPAFTQWLTTCL